MTIQDIEEVKKQFIYAAELCYYAGFQMIQIHAAGGQLLQQFLSDVTNKRMDEYGGNIKNRAKFVIDIIKGIRAKIGNSIILSIRLCVDELYNNQGIKIDIYKEILPLLEDAGIDIIIPFRGNYDTWKKIYIEKQIKIRDRLINDMKILKGITKKFIGYNGCVFSLKIGEEICKMADFIGIARALFVDDQMIVKTLEGKEQEIKECINCTKCFSDIKLNSTFGIVKCFYNK